MILALSLGLTGSLGHCVGMCSGMLILFKRHPAIKGSRLAWAALHGGRLTTYAMLGGLAGFAGQLLGLQIGTFKQFQGLIAFLMAGLALYFALALMGRLPSPDRATKRLSAAWGRRMRQYASKGSDIRNRGLAAAYGMGLLWGLLPCGLVLAAVFTAAESTSFLFGAVRMLAFGLGTIPALAAVTWLSGRTWRLHWPRYAAAALMAGFGAQFALRGLASWGLLPHQMLSGVMLW